VEMFWKKEDVKRLFDEKNKRGESAPIGIWIGLDDIEDT